MHNHYLMELLKDGMDISLISSQIEQNEMYYSDKHIFFNGISSMLPQYFRYFGKSKFLHNGLRSLQDYLISLDMANVIKSQSIDVIEFMDIHSEGYAYLKRNSKNYRKTKVIIRSHTPWGLLKSYYSSDERKGVDGLWAFERENFCFNTCDAITTPSEDLKNHLIHFYKLPEEKIIVIPNIIDTNHFMPSPRESDNQPFTILHVGRFERAKGVITLIKAFIEFAKFHKECKLVNIGQPRGSSYEQCHGLLKSADMIEKVKFAGFLSYEELPKYYANADVVVVASEIYESFSYAVAQGMSCGKPVIASDIGGIPETLNNGNCGNLFRPGDKDSLYCQLEELYSDERKRNELGRNARLFVENNFSINALKNRYTDFYKSLLD